MKKILSLSLAISLLSMAFAGCGGAAPAASSQASEPSSAASSSSASGSGEKITLTFMRTGTPEQLHPIFDPIIAEYEKQNPNVKIDMQDLGWGDAEKTIQTMAASKTLPDVMYHLPGTIFDLADKGLVLDLAPYVDEELKNDMYPAMMQAGQYDGKQYMISCGGSTLILWYNTEMFKAAGLDPDNPPATWDDFLAACEKLKTLPGVSPLGLYAKSSGGETSFVYESLFTSAFGGSAWDSAKKQYAYDQDSGKDAAVKALKFIQDCTQYAQDSFVEYGRFDVRTLLRDGKVAMVLDLINMANQIPEELNSGKFKAAMVPAAPGGKSSSAVNVGGWYIPTNSKHPDEAWKFLRFLMNTDNQLAHAKYGAIPMLKSEAATYQSGYIMDVIKGLDNSYPEGICPQSNALWTVNGEQLQLLMMGKQTPKETRENILSEHAEIYK